MSAHSGSPSDATETHLSWLWFTGDRVLKRLKPLRTDFVDHSTVARRAHSIRRELDLNRRIAADVYLGTGEVREDGEITDHLLVMRRMPADRRLAGLVGTDEFGDRLRDVARTVAIFHAGLPPDPGAGRVAGPDGLAARWAADLDECDRFADVLDPDLLEEARARSTAYLRGRRPLLERRVADGWARDGHGDLLADDIFCLDDGPRILDCLAFDDDLRRGDVVADVAFLAMDVERLAGRDWADCLWEAYAEFLGERHPVSLAHLHVAQRALVRAKVSAIRSAQLGVPDGEPAAEEADTRLRQCVEHLRDARARLVLVGGAPGTGKTTLARALSERFGWVHLSSDETRKQQAGLAARDRASAPVGEGIYSAAMTARTYEELVERGVELVGMGESVVLDATWSRGDQRDAARRAAGGCEAELSELRCVAPPEVVAARVRARVGSGDDASDADEEVAAALAATFEPWPEATEVGPDPDLDRLLRREPAPASSPTRRARRGPPRPPG